jgi:hypothetical protein
MTAFSELKKRARAKNHDISDVVPSSAGALSTATETGKDVAERAVGRRVVNVPVLAETDPGDVIGEKPVLCVPSSSFPNGAKVVEISRRDDTAVTADDTNYGTDAFVARDYLGVNNTTVASVLSKITGGTNDTVAQAKVAVTLTSTLTDRVIPPDGCLTLTRTKASGGVQFPDQLYTIVFEAL